MRADALGLFWEDLPKVRGAGARGPRTRGPMPTIPETGWRPPTEYPNLSAAKVIGFDTETWDPELLDAGPGWGRGKGHIIGASLSVEDGSSWYFPIRHGIEDGNQILPEHEAAMNMDPENTLRYLAYTLGDTRPKVGANLIYDVGWLLWEGVPVRGPLYDIQFAEALLNSEAPKVDLDILGESYLGRGKETNLLYQFLADWCGGQVNDKQRKHMYISPPSLAGPYAQDDASMPIAILDQQWRLMQERGVIELFNLECKLIPLLVAMRMKGAPVNLNKADEVYDDFGAKLEVIETKLKDIAGQHVNPNAAESIKSAFTALSIPHPTKINKKTGEKVISFDAPRLESVEHPLVDQILEWRRLTKVRSVFIDSYLRQKHVNNRIHCTFHPLKGSGVGTRSGRFSSSDPNLQNIPVRTEEGRLVRECFDATVFGGRWRSIDYSSIEYRLLVHFAVGEGADLVREQFNKNPDTDYHQFVMDMIERMTGILLTRSVTKNVNFGLIYGMALNALAALLKIPRNEASHLMDSYHEAIPYARATMDECAREVHTTGCVRTILNRASDFNAWGPKGWSNDGRRYAMTYEAASRKWGMYNIERQHTHKALNRKLQGSAADVMKTAMVAAWEAGLFAEDACGIPVLTVHDELDFEDMGSPDNPAWLELKHIMETCMGNKVSIPLRVDAGIGDTWAQAH